MSLTAAAIRLLGSKGLSVEEIAEIADANASAAVMDVETSAERRRRMDRERKARARSADKADNSAEVADSHRPQNSAENADNSAEIADFSAAPRAHVRDITSNSEIYPRTVVDAGASAGVQHDDWPEGDLLLALAEQVDSPRFDPSKSQGLHTSSGRIVGWRRAGASWEHDVLPIVKALCAKSRTPIRSLDYFREAIAQSIADNRRALTIPEAQTHARTGQNDFQSARDEGLRNHHTGAMAALNRRLNVVG